MASTGSVSRWISGVRSGSNSAATQIWDRFGPRLLAVARAGLKGRSVAVADEEDAAFSAFHSFLRRTAAGSYENLANRDDLWRLLVTMTNRKVLNQIRDLNCAKRQAHQFEERSDFQTVEPETSGPEYVAMMKETVSGFLSLLNDGELQEIVLLRMDGYSFEEIAEKIGRSVPTVERRMRLVRAKLQHEIEK